MVCSHPPTAYRLEKEISDGHGLLANDGASRTSLFSGDALNIMIIASSLFDASKTQDKQLYAFSINPYSFTRSLDLTLWDTLVELRYGISQLNLSTCRYAQGLSSISLVDGDLYFSNVIVHHGYQLSLSDIRISLAEGGIDALILQSDSQISLCVQAERLHLSNFDYRCIRTPQDLVVGVDQRGFYYNYRLA
jgi:hypothetical protein